MASTFEDEFGDLLHDLITIEPFAGRAARGGVPAYGTPIVGVPCRWERRQRAVRGPDGSMVLSGSFVRCRYVAGLTTEARVTLPDGSTPPVLAVETSPDESGALYSMRVSFT